MLHTFILQLSVAQESDEVKTNPQSAPRARELRCNYICLIGVNPFPLRGD